MPKPITVDITINATPQQVFDYTFNLDNAPHWMNNLTAIRAEPNAPLAVGSTIHETRKMLGKEHTETFVIQSIDPPHASTWTCASRGVDYTVHHTFAPTPQGTLLTWEMIITPKGLLSNLMCSLMGTGMMRKMLLKDLQSLKAAIESHEPSPQEPA